MQKIESIEKGSGDRFGIYWVAAILSKDDPRFFRNRLQISDKGDTSQVVATDSTRVHIFNTINHYEPGYYKVIKNTKGSTVLEFDVDLLLEEYPDWEIFFPEEEPEWSENVIGGSDIEDISLAYIKIIRAMMDECFLNFRYLQDALLIGDMLVKIYNDKAPIILSNDNCRCVLALMRK